ELGFRLGKTVVLYDAERTSFAGQQPGQQQAFNADVEVPPVDFDWKAGDAWPPPGARPQGKPPSPVRKSMLLAARGVGKNLDLPIRYPRPVYYEPGVRPEWFTLFPGALPAPFPANVPWAGLYFAGWPGLRFNPEIMTTNPAASNELQPFA